MIRETQTIWKGEDGGELLRHKYGDVYYIPLSEVKASALRELKAAIEDALSDDLARAIKDARGKEK